MNSGGACGKNCEWISYSLLAGACMGTGTFLFASRFSDLGILGKGLLGPGPTIYCLVLRLFNECKYRRKNGY